MDGLAPASPPFAIEMSGLEKAYRTGLLGKPSRPAVRALTLAVPRGEIFGYLGPNGSGKTTTLKILMGLVYPDAGSASVLGFPLGDPAWRHRVGYLPEHPYFYDYLTATEYLDYVGRLFGMSRSFRKERARDLLKLVGLDRSAGMPLRSFSKGMLQRIGIAQALMNDPELLFLDEPMSGLDPLGRRLVRDLVLDQRQKGKTIFFSTHILTDAETLCDRVALLRRGELLKVGRLDQILAMDVTHVEVLVRGIERPALDRFPPGVNDSHAVGERWRLEVEEGALGSIVRAVEEAGGRVLSVQPIRQSLEDLFVKEMGTEETGEQWQAVD